MIGRRAVIGFLAPRLVFSAFCFVTSLYCLIAFIPFTYQQVIEFRVVSWTSGFAQYHPWLYWVALACAAWTLRNDYRRGTRALVATVVAAGVITGVGLSVSPLLPGLGNDAASLGWAAAWLLPLCAVALVDLAGSGRRIVWARPAEGQHDRLLRTCLLTGGALALVYAAIQPVRARGIVIGLASAGVVAWSLILHLVVFVAIFLVLAIIVRVASMWRRPALAEFVLAAVVCMATLTWVIDTLIFAAVSLVDATGQMLAVWFGIALGLMLAGWAVRLAGAGEPVSSGIELALLPINALAGRSKIARGLMLVVWMGSACWLAAVTSAMDWNYLFQKLGAITIWTVGFGWIYAAIGSDRHVGHRAWVVRWAVPAAVVAIFATATAVPASMMMFHLPAGTNSATIDHYAAYDVSFHIVHDLTRFEASPSRGAMAGFYALLRRHTNIPRTVTITAPDVALVPVFRAPSGRLPHVFFLAIDSLRPDYLSPYNPAVTFTPAIERFAAESTVFRHAFTRYGATGLSEPALWTGTAVPHQQYPNEYWRMNSLQKLLEAGQYRAFVSKDHILQRLLAPWPALTDLDQGRNARDYDVCRTLSELEDKITTRDRADVRPLFAYTQPQNVHIAAITREGGTVPAGEFYPGFYAPYASRVHRLDTCFGQFIDVLRREQLYDDSLIILTSDHGESIGEEGRWGHAYTLFPEVLKIPIFVHLPAWMRGVGADPDLIAFTVDLTPTIYYLLGERPITNNPLFGRPLFTERPDEVTPYLRSRYVAASSYGPVYAVISDAGRSLYIADGVSDREYAFDLTTGPGGTSRPVTDAERDAGVRAIRDMIRELTRFARVPLDPQ